MQELCEVYLVGGLYRSKSQDEKNHMVVFILL